MGRVSNWTVYRDSFQGTVSECYHKSALHMPNACAHTMRYNQGAAHHIGLVPWANGEAKLLLEVIEHSPHQSTAVKEQPSLVCGSCAQRSIDFSDLY